ncbi:MAG: amidohydrolase [Oscillospiraceae bacterium]
MQTLIYNVTAVLMDDARTVLPHACVLVDGGKILSVGTKRPDDFHGDVLDGNGQVLMPGFVNAHTHIPMTLMRGYGSGCDLQTWLSQYIFPTEDKWDPRAIRAATGLGLLEMIASGTTCIADMYMFCDDIADVVASSGMNAHIDRGCTLFGDDFDPKTHQGFADMTALVDKWHGYNDGQIRVDACLHGEYTSNHKLWEAMAQFARDRDLGMHVHLSETKLEHEECIQRNGMTPAATFAKYGVFDTPTIAAHCVWTTPEDWDILASHGVTTVHNPASNLKLGSGIAKIPAMKKAGVNIALGTDGASSNNTADMFSDMKLAALLNNGATCDPAALTAYDALEMATKNGGIALGRKTGKIEAGYDADLILVDFNRPHLMPCHDVIENLVYAAHCSDVTMTMARGKVLYRDGKFLTLDVEKIQREVTDYALPLLFR